MIGALVNALAGRSLDTGLAGGGLKFNFLPRLFQRVDTDGDNMARTSNFANVATVTRASTKTNAGGWDFTSGGTVGTLTEYASGVAAIHATAGLLVEESTTNEIRNPRCEGAVAGSPGTLPSNWFSTLGAVTQTVIGSGSENGWHFIDVSFTFSGAANPQMYFESPTQVTAANGETWTASCGLKILSDPSGVLSSVLMRQRESTSGGATVQNNDAAATGFGSTHKRFSQTVTLSGGGTVAAVNAGLVFVSSGAGTVDVRIYAPQLEEKAYPTSPVLPVVSSPAATTRAADSIQIPNGAWANAGGDFTIYGEATTPPAESSFPTIVDYADAAQDRISIQALGAGDSNVYWSCTIASSSVLSFSKATKSGGETIKFGVAAQADNVAASIDTMAQVVDTSCDTSQIGSAVLNLGQNRIATGQSRLYIKDLRYWPKRLTNAELEALVGN